MSSLRESGGTRRMEECMPVKAFDGTLTPLFFGQRFREVIEPLPESSKPNAHTVPAFPVRRRLPTRIPASSSIALCMLFLHHALDAGRETLPCRGLRAYKLDSRTVKTSHTSLRRIEASHHAEIDKQSWSIVGC